MSLRGLLRIVSRSTHRTRPLSPTVPDPSLAPILPILPSPISALLPLELLQIIFVLSLPVKPDDPFTAVEVPCDDSTAHLTYLHILARVCRIWHHVVLGTSEFWSRVATGTPAYATRRALHVNARWPLHVTLEARVTCLLADTLAADGHASRLATLHLSGFDHRSKMQLAPLFSHTLVNVRSLVLEHGASAVVPLPSSAFPALNSLQLRYAGLNAQNMADLLTRITRLELTTKSHPDQILTVLIAAPLLETMMLRFDSHVHREARSSELPVLPRLRHTWLVCRTPDSCQELLASLSLPVVAYISLSCTEPTGPAWQAWGKYLRTVLTDKLQHGDESILVRICETNDPTPTFVSRVAEVDIQLPPYWPSADS
ncbi:hypothetical protein BC834DRAFT_891145 [Gloeopeniophorella convolvens]|nr:hypothetical protein BC834DRAFT_891145 [Gloeopeniophorella convolvens]